jgi:hypothetical protein
VTAILKKSRNIFNFYQDILDLPIRLHNQIMVAAFIGLFFNKGAGDSMGLMPLTLSLRHSPFYK